MTDVLEHAKVLARVNHQKRAARPGWSCRDHSLFGPVKQVCVPSVRSRVQLLPEISATAQLPDWCPAIRTIALIV